MKRTIEVTIMGQKFMVRSEADEAYVRQVADYVNSKVDEVISSTRSVASLNVALLAAMNITDEFFRYKKKKGEVLDRVGKRLDNMIELIELHV